MYLYSQTRYYIDIILNRKPSLKRKLKNKGYGDSQIEEAYNKYLLLYESAITAKADASDITVNDRCKENHIQDKLDIQQLNFGTFWYFSTFLYSNKFWHMQRILQKNWDILKKDHVLGNLIPDGSSFIYRKPSDLRSLVAPGRISLPKKSSNSR